MEEEGIRKYAIAEANNAAFEKFLPKREKLSRQSSISKYNILSRGFRRGPLIPAPEGYVPVIVGDEDQQYIVPAYYLKNTCFAELLKNSVSAYLQSFKRTDRRGKPQLHNLKIQCDIDTFEQLIFSIGDPRCVYKVIPNATINNANSLVSTAAPQPIVPHSISNILNRSHRTKTKQEEEEDAYNYISNLHRGVTNSTSRTSIPDRIFKQLKPDTKQKSGQTSNNLQQEIIGPARGLFDPGLENYENNPKVRQTMRKNIEAMVSESELSLSPSRNYCGEEMITLLVGHDYVTFDVPKLYLSHPLFKELLIKCAHQMPYDPEVFALPSIDAFAFGQFISLIEVDDLEKAIKHMTSNDKEPCYHSHGRLRQHLCSLGGDMFPKLFNRKNQSHSPNNNELCVPSGHVLMIVGEHEQKQFVVPISYIEEPLFQHIIRVASTTDAGYQGKGVLKLSCEVETFEQLLELLEKNKRTEKAYR